MKWNRLLLMGLLAGIIVFSFAFIGCAPPEEEIDEEVEEEVEEEPEDPEEKELVVANYADVSHLDPHQATDTASHWVNNQIYDGLVQRTEDMGVEPSLAEDWEFVDDRTVEFYLREGVTFHNGEEFTAHDVKFTYERLLDEDEAFAGASRLEMVDVENIEVIDDHTIQIPTHEPFGAILTYLAHSSSLIINQEAVEEYGEDYNQNPIGTGPFEFEEWQEGDRVVLSAYEDYWGGAPEIERLVFRAVPEGTNRTIELETGGAHVAESIERMDLDRIEEHEELDLHVYEILRIAYMGYNCVQEPFDDPRVRQALNWAIDVEAMAETVYGELGTPASGFTNSNIWAHNPDVETYTEQDMEKAQELLEEAGYEDGFEITITINDDDERRDLAEVASSMWAELGVETEVEILEWGTFLDATGEGDIELFFLGWLASTGDPHHAMHPLFHSDNHGGGGNRTFYTNEEVDALLDEGVVEPDEDERFAIYQETQEIIAEDAPWLPLIDVTDAVGVHEDVVGFEPCPSGYHMFDEVDLQQ